MKTKDIFKYLDDNYRANKSREGFESWHKNDDYKIEIYNIPEFNQLLIMVSKGSLVRRNTLNISHIIDDSTIEKVVEITKEHLDKYIRGE